MTFLRTFSVVTLLCAASALHVIAQDSESRSIHDGVYTEAQAEQGAKLWQNICGECHQIDEFQGPAYMSSWTNVPVAELFDLISVTMPEDNPGSLRDGEYVAVIAYLFSMNGVAAGEDTLPDNYEALSTIVIQEPYSSP